MSEPIRLPEVAAPDVSVLLIVHNAWEWTARAIEALRDTTPPRYELIAVDNASSDGAAEGLDAVEGALVVHNPRNAGFGPAANQAAGLARGRWLYLLNSDALLQPGWLEPLLDVATADPAVAAAGSRLLNLDGTLQEAGALVFADGTVLNYGDGEPAGDPQHSFVRDVDYASAAALLVRRDLFAQVGGFDPVYAPAYMEDVDLCLQLRALGHRIVYQPFSTAVHVRWASGDRSSTVALLQRNLPVFRERWQHVLRRRLPNPGGPDPRLVLAARDVECVDRVLVLAAAPPVPAAVAAAARDAVGHDLPIRITVVPLDPAVSAAQTEPLRRAGIEAAWGVADLPRWLEQRRLHYTVVLSRDTPPADVAAALDRHQPAARRALNQDGLG